ncbi:MAG: hypothetical protein ACHQ1D_03055 [Nitrososphaerales archaeon]
MKDLELIASFGDERRIVKIVQPHLSGDQYQVLIDNWCQGMIMKARGEWVAYWNAKSDLGVDDVSMISDLIEKNVE